jgi:hypothetical protein
MTTPPKRTRRSSAAAASKPLPPIKTGKFTEGLGLVEEVVSANVSAFVGAGQRYREQHRAATTRELAATEVATIANGLGSTLAEAKSQLGLAGIRAYDEPNGQEILFAGLTGSSAAMVRAVMRLTALVEMDTASFKEACKEDRLAAAIDDAVAVLDDLDLSETRVRAAAAWDHFAKAMGYESGKGLTLIAKTLWAAISAAMRQMAPTPPESSFIESPADTDGPATPSSST